jgi:RHS repeat-associated protein
LNQSGAVVKDYIYAGGQHVAEIYNGRTYITHTDHLGSTRTVSDYAGNVTDSMDYMPYGEQIFGGSSTTHRFTGQERDSESGLDNFGARYDSSSLGRFMTPDPLGGRLIDPQTLNKYSYVRNNPINLTDPTGMYTCEDDENKCKTKQDLAFEKARQQDLKSTDANVVRAAKSYGDPTKDNGVGVRFGDPGNGTGGNTTSSVRQDPNDPNKYQAEETVTIRPGQSGTDLAATVGHEGSHVADAQDFVNSITAIGVADQSLNLTKYQTELKAYMVTQSILASGNEQRSFGDCGLNLCILGTGIQPSQAQQTINLLLANPRNGYGVTPERPGPIMYPNLTTPK